MLNLIKTKIIATVGPACSDEEKITQMINAGARVFRINSSHGNVNDHKASIEVIRKVSKKLNKHIAILLDLQGPKIRVGNLKAPMTLKDEDKIVIKPDINAKSSDYIPVDYEGITKDVRKGEKILLDDGKIELEALNVTAESITAKVIHGGILNSRKGLNIPGTTASIPAVTEKDAEYIKFAVENDLDYLALSFVRVKEDILTAKDYVNKYKGDIPVIAKIEKPQALDNLEMIISASDGIMVARGDLGIEISPEQVPIMQKKIIKEANNQRKPVITATQMLESMILQPLPTRAEAADVANAIIDGTDAVMLSGETAVGSYPVEAVTMMASISRNVEASKLLSLNDHHQKGKDIYEVDSQAIASAVVNILGEIEIDAIIAFTRSGFTAKLLSKVKPSVPIIAISDKEVVCRRLNLYWDVFPYLMKFDESFTEELLKNIDEKMIKEKILNAGDKVIITGGLPYLSVGKTNFIRLHQIGSSGTLY